MSTTHPKPSAFLLLVLNTPLIAEIVRKYFLHSDLVFFLTEALVLIVGTTVLTKGTGFPRLLRLGFWVSSWLYLAWGLVGEILSNNPLPIYLIGLGTAVLPFFHLVVSVAYCRDNPSAAISRYFWCISLWLVAMGIVAIAQIYSGQDGWFSQYGLGYIGNGDYTVDGRGVEGLFRPTSIFMHTGKFGQTIFAFVLFKFCVLFYRRSRPPLLVIFVGSLGHWRCHSFGTTKRIPIFDNRFVRAFSTWEQLAKQIQAIVMSRYWHHYNFRNGSRAWATETRCCLHRARPIFERLYRHSG